MAIIVNSKEYHWLRNEIEKQCLMSNIFRFTDALKKKNDIIDNIAIALINANINTDEMNELILDIINNNVLSVEILDNGGDLFSPTYLKQKWLNVAKNLFSRRSTGIGTPNAASGEGELMFLFLCGGKIKKPTSGDLEIDGKIYELKGLNARIQGNISGKDFRLKTLDVAKKFNINPNLSHGSNIFAVEIEKREHIEHYSSQLNNNPKKIEFINSWLKCIDNNDHTDSASKCFVNENLDLILLKKEIVKILFRVHLGKAPFYKYVMLNDGVNVRVISNTPDDFDKEIDIGSIPIHDDYFRVLQNFPIGWYIS